ncbi:MAG TPA: hypothetical protein VE093_05495 [Polyangiaceae bacterium]|nr:hypothetical protein [Polyangiaceae bacterium]
MAGPSRDAEHVALAEQVRELFDQAGLLKSVRAAPASQCLVTRTWVGVSAAQASGKTGAPMANQASARQSAPGSR